ncbi:MAG TPA: hypothetical protein VFE47_21555 [Tepidisphaeraceae bacterium]|nr:hypothetical protein [Tepidisphaeraceae bacterium]
MRIIETTAHIGSDGMLRLEVPLEQRNRDVRVAVVVESAIAQQRSEPVDDQWAGVREKAKSAGIHTPPAGVVNCGPVEPIVLPGRSASEILISDRR